MSNTVARVSGRLPSPSLFRSFFLGGFECSTHCLASGRRLDMIAATRHDTQAASDYRQLREHGLRTVRDGLRWHLIETGPGVYDWSSFQPMLRAARQTGMQVIWDLCHYGWPDGLDIWTPDFVDRFGRFAGAAARLVRDETDAVPFYCPINEISFWGWGGGQVGYLNPYAQDRGVELKEQLARAVIAAVEAVRAVEPKARFIHAEPAIHITAHRPADRDLVAKLLPAQWQAWDMIGGRLSPGLGGRPDYLDILGVNFYPINQWVHESGPIPLGRHDYRPFRDILADIYARYQRPLFVSETGAEGGAGPAWLHYIADEVQAARANGVPVEGVCLYPVLDYPGWDNDRVCPVGLLRLEQGSAGREVNEPLAAELRRQRNLITPKERAALRPTILRQARRGG